MKLKIFYGKIRKKNEKVIPMKNIVLITGASRGIGAKTAIYFAEQGFDVAINFEKNETAAKEVAEKIESFGRRALLVQGDVSNPDVAKRIAETVQKELGTIGVLVNNAGISKQALFTDITPEEASRIYEVNVGGMFYMTSAVLPQMIHEKSGSIINVSSIWGLCGASCEVHYSASKAAVIGATKALAKELAPSNIRVNCVAPGVIQTDMNAHLSKEDMEILKDETPLGKIGTPEDVAKAIFFLASDEFSSFTTGQILSPNGGFFI